ncbi:hypothetical protein QJS66_06960 [Kocuria rhizophila]|nr:hypothetical protein QJS66_06960 [Kocuria rhizophila]
MIKVASARGAVRRLLQEAGYARRDRGGLVQRNLRAGARARSRAMRRAALRRGGVHDHRRDPAAAAGNAGCASSADAAVQVPACGPGPSCGPVRELLDEHRTGAGYGGFHDAVHYRGYQDLARALGRGCSGRAVTPWNWWPPWARELRRGAGPGLRGLRTARAPHRGSSRSAR